MTVRLLSQRLIRCVTKHRQPGRSAAHEKSRGEKASDFCGAKTAPCSSLCLVSFFPAHLCRVRLIHFQSSFQVLDPLFAGASSSPAAGESRKELVFLRALFSSRSRFTLLSCYTLVSLLCSSRRNPLPKCSSSVTRTFCRKLGQRKRRRARTA